MRPEDTEEILRRHHGDERFADLMIETFDGRFNAAFWSFWEAYAAPVIGEAPRLVDLGTGPGLMLEAWSNRHPGGTYYGVDFMDYMLESARRYTAQIEGAVIHPGDLHQPELEVDTGSVDAVLAAALIHEMVQPVRLLHEVRRILKPGGRLVVLDWVRTPLSEYLDDNQRRELFREEVDDESLDWTFTHFAEHNRYTVGDLRFILEQCGLEVLEAETYKQGQFARIAAERKGG